MSKGKIILWLGLPAFIGALVLSLVLQPREPVYHGYSLTQWLDDYYADSRADINDDSPHTEAYFAIRTIGTNALPTLLDWVAHKPPEPNPRLAEFADHLPDAIANNRFVWSFTHPEWRGYFPLQGFIILGADANGAVPELTRLMRAPDAQNDGLNAALALAYIGPAGLPPLEAAAINPSARCWGRAITALGEFGASPMVLPVLNRMLTNTDERVRYEATNLLKEGAFEAQLQEEQHGSLTIEPPSAPVTNTVTATSILKDISYKPVAACLLAFVSKEDDRPWYVDDALLLLQFPKGKWMLVHAARNPRFPQGQKPGSTAWSVHSVTDSPPVGYQSFDHRPTREEMDEFLKDNWWQFESDKSSRVVSREVDEATWQKMLGYKSPLSDKP